MSSLHELIFGTKDVTDKTANGANDQEEASTNPSVSQQKERITVQPSSTSRKKRKSKSLEKRQAKKRRTGKSTRSDDSSYHDEAEESPLDSDDDGGHDVIATARPKRRQLQIGRSLHIDDIDDNFMDDEVAEFLHPDRIPHPVRTKPARKPRQDEWEEMRARWKVRKYDLRDEQDIGAAVFYQVSNAFKQTNKTDRSPPDDASPVAGSDTTDNSQVHNDDDDNPAAEQTILNQLLQGSQPSQENDTQQVGVDFQLPYKYTLNWWDMGYTAPRDVTEPVFSIHEPSTQIDDDDVSYGTTQDSHVVSVPFKTAHVLRKTAFPFGPPGRQWFPLSARPDPFFSQPRHLVSLVSRLVGCGASAVKHLELLWRLHQPVFDTASHSNEQKHQRTWFTQGLVEDICFRRGQSLILFYHYNWKDRNFATNLLANYSDIDFLPREPYFPRSLRSNITGKDASIDLSVTRYIHLPGTRPPIPSFPLDPTEIIWGQKGRYNDVHHSQKATSVVDESVYKVSVAALLAMDEVAKARELMRRAVQINQSLYTRRRGGAHRMKEFEIPQHHFAETVAFALTIADEPFELLDTVIEHNGLRMFRDLHLTYTLVCIARALPEVAATFVAEESVLEPVDFIRVLLEDRVEYDKCSREEVEFILHKQLNSIAVQRNPTDTRWHCWRVALLSGSLYLCGAGDEQFSTLQDVRRNLAEAFYSLVELSHTLQSACAHEAIKSVCEWKTVAALLFGSDQLCNVRELHRFHVQRWKSLDATTTASTEFGDPDIEHAMLEVERRPDKISNWIYLVEALGPVGSEDPNDCCGCQRWCCLLCDGLHANHRSAHWRDRNWWKTSLLLTLSAQPEANLLDSQDEISSAIGEVQKGAEAMVVLDTKTKGRSFSLHPPNLDWLESLVAHIDTSECLAGEELADAIQSIHGLEKVAVDKDLTGEGNCPMNYVDEAFASLTCKILIYCHQGFICNDDVGVLMMELLNIGWEGNKFNSDCTKCLRYLQQCGVDVRKLFHRATQHFWNRFLHPKHGTVWRCT